MKKIDIWLTEPTDIKGYGTCFPNVIHIDSTENGGYIENDEDGILFFSEMSRSMLKNVEAFVNTLPN